MAYSTINLLQWTSRRSMTVNGIVYTYNNDGSFTGSGTATDTASNNLFIGDIANCPLRVGDTYYCSYTASLIRFRIDFYTSATRMDSTTRISYYLTRSSGQFTVPANTVGIQIRIYVQSGVTVNETVTPAIYFDITNMSIADIIVYYALTLADDQQFHYYNAGQGESNLGPFTFDCATFNSYCFYLAMGWTDWPSSSHGSVGYFWPYITQAGYDAFLILNGWVRHPFDSSLLSPGAIIITTESLHHSLFYIGNNQICDANNYFGYADNSIAVRSYPTYSESEFAYIYIPPQSQPSPADIKYRSPRTYRYLRRR